MQWFIYSYVCGINFKTEYCLNMSNLQFTLMKVPAVFIA